MNIEEKNKRRVLICDDDIVSRNINADYVAKLGYEIVGHATTGIDAMNQFAEKNPNVILLDINMPLGSGFTVLSFIRDISSTVVVVMITGDPLYFTPETVLKTLEIGANDYLIKGNFDEDRLREAIEKDDEEHGEQKTVKKEDLIEMFDMSELDDLELDSPTAETKDEVVSKST